VEPAPSVPVRIDIGCGKTTPEGWIGVDRLPFGQKWTADLSKTPWKIQSDECPPFKDVVSIDIYPAVYCFDLPDSSVDEARSSHFVEHLTGTERIAFFNELWRVLKPNATAIIVTPNWSHECAYGDPTHQWPPMSKWYPLYLHRDWRAVNAPHAGYTCHFDHVIAGSWDGSIETRNAEYKQMAMQNYTNAFRDLIVTLTKRE
jgi:predicted SAM-dependent methyltransferase